MGSNKNKEKQALLIIATMKTKRNAEPLILVIDGESKQSTTKVRYAGVRRDIHFETTCQTNVQLVLTFPNYVSPTDLHLSWRVSHVYSPRLRLCTPFTANQLELRPRVCCEVGVLSSSGCELGLFIRIEGRRTLCPPGKLC